MKLRFLSATIILGAIGLAAAGGASATDTKAALAMCKQHAFCDASAATEDGHIYLTVDNGENGSSVIDCPAGGGECHVMHITATPGGVRGPNVTLASPGKALSPAPTVNKPIIPATTLAKPFAARR